MLQEDDRLSEEERADIKRATHAHSAGGLACLKPVNALICLVNHYDLLAHGLVCHGLLNALWTAHLDLSALVLLVSQQHSGP